MHVQGLDLEGKTNKARFEFEICCQLHNHIFSYSFFMLGFPEQISQNYVKTIDGVSPEIIKICLFPFMGKSALLRIVFAVLLDM